MFEGHHQRWSNQAAATAGESPTRLAISTRDRRIIERALRKLGGMHSNFHEAMRALRESVEEVIPDGRVFLLGHTEHGPIIGSIISGVGIVDHPLGIRLVRAKPGDVATTLGNFSR